jgi:hypothetical protein
MSRSPAKLPEGLTSTPFHVQAARAAGVTPDRLRGRDLARPFHGVRSLSPPSGVVELCAAFRPRMRSDDIFSHGTAAALWGMPLPGYVTDARLHVTSPEQSRAVRGRGVAGHTQRLHPDDLSTVQGLPVASPQATWVQLSTTLPWWELLAIGEFIITGLPFDSVLSLASEDDIDLAHRRAGASRGSRARRRALGHLREGAFSRPESLCRLLFELAGLPEPLINCPVLDARGSFLGLPDLIWPEFKVAFEYEGDFHREKADTDVTSTAESVSSTKVGES